MLAPARSSDHLAAGNANMHRNVMTRFVGELRHAIADRNRRANSAFGIVSMSDRCAEYPHDTVANVLVDRAAVTQNRAIGEVKKCVEQGVNFFRVEPPGKLGVTD